MSRKKLMTIGVLVAVGVALYYWLRKSGTGVTGQVLDPSNNARLSQLFDIQNPGIKS